MLWIDFAESNVPNLLVSVWIKKLSSGGSDESWQLKTWRILDSTGGVGGDHSFGPAQGWWSNNPNKGSMNIFANDAQFWPNYYETCKPVCNGVSAYFDFPNNAWIHQTIFIKQGTPNTADGKVIFWVDGVKVTEETAMITATTGSTSTRAIFGYYMGLETEDPAYTNQVFELYFDDIYIDNSWQSVWVGNSMTWNGSGHREIQLPSVWSDNSITVMLNQGSFQNGQQAYLYVVDSNGNVNANGYPITIGSPSQYHRADTSQDGCIDSSELTAFIDKWKVNNQDVTLRELIEAIGLWKKGC
jgi:hypothetical protein